jgi:hypothetical protein
MGWVFEITLKPDGEQPSERGDTVVVYEAESAEEAIDFANTSIQAVNEREGESLSWSIASIFANIGDNPAKGYKAQVIADSSGQWCSNALVFATVKEAQGYNADLYSRWTSVRQVRVIPIDEEPTHFWTDAGELGNIERPETARKPARSVQL